MLLFVCIFGGALRTGVQYVDYVVHGLIVLCAGFGAGTTAVAVATDMTNEIVDRFRSMPISSPSILIGHVTASLARNLVATALVIGVGIGVGWRPTESPGRWLAAIAMIVLFVLALSWLAAAAGLLAGKVEVANSVTFVLMFLPYVSTAFVPTRTLPTWLRGVASHQPFTPMVETMRGLWMGHTSTGTPVSHDALLALTAKTARSAIWPSMPPREASAWPAAKPEPINPGHRSGSSRALSGTLSAGGWLCA